MTTPREKARKSIEEAVRLGYLEPVVGADGTTGYQLTERGRACLAAAEMGPS